MYSLMSALAWLTLSYARRYTRSYFTLLHSRSTNTLSRHAPTVHAELRASPEHRAGELLSGELAALIGINDLRDTEPRKRLFNNLDRMMRLKRKRPICTVLTAPCEIS